jgi:hypothetical protein
VCLARHGFFLNSTTTTAATGTAREIPRRAGAV